MGHERDHRRGGRRRPSVPRAPTRDRGRRARRAGTHVRDAAVAEGCGRAGGTRRGGLPDPPRRRENGTGCGDALGSRAHSWWSRKGSADVRAVVPAHRRERPIGPRAGFWRRFAASFLDGIILGVVYFIISVVISENAAAGLNLVLSAGYYTYFEGGTSGQTSARRRSGSGSSTSAAAARSGTAAASSAGSAGSSRHPAAARLLLDALGQGEADLARQVRRLGRRARVRVPGLTVGG